MAKLSQNAAFRLARLQSSNTVPISASTALLPRAQSAPRGAKLSERGGSFRTWVSSRFADMPPTPAKANQDSGGALAAARSRDHASIAVQLSVSLPPLTPNSLSCMPTVAKRPLRDPVACTIPRSAHGRDLVRRAQGEDAGAVTAANASKIKRWRRRGGARERAVDCDPVPRGGWRSGRAVGRATVAPGLLPTGVASLDDPPCSLRCARAGSLRCRLRRHEGPKGPVRRALRAAGVTGACSCGHVEGGCRGCGNRERSARPAFELASAAAVATSPRQHLLVAEKCALGAGPPRRQNSSQVACFPQDLAPTARSPVQAGVRARPFQLRAVRAPIVSVTRLTSRGQEFSPNTSDLEAVARVAIAVRSFCVSS